jgi:hypothetical protein
MGHAESFTKPRDQNVLEDGVAVRDGTITDDGQWQIGYES